jgi:hypothetical protein
MDSDPTPKIGFYTQKPKPNTVINKCKPNHNLCKNKEPYQLTAFSVLFMLCWEQQPDLLQSSSNMVRMCHMQDECKEKRIHVDSSLMGCDAMP